MELVSPIGICNGMDPSTIFVAERLVCQSPGVTDCQPTNAPSPLEDGSVVGNVPARLAVLFHHCLDTAGVSDTEILQVLIWAAP